MLTLVRVYYSCDKDPRSFNIKSKMTLPTENSACKCNTENCSNCKCGCGPSCCSKDKDSIDKSAIPSYPEISACPFVKAHPNWQKCPVMVNMFEASHGIKDEPAEDNGETCDTSKCSKMSASELNHIVTLQMDTELATDQSEENTL